MVKNVAQRSKGPAIVKKARNWLNPLKAIRKCKKRLKKYVENVCSPIARKLFISLRRCLKLVNIFVARANGVICACKLGLGWRFFVYFFCFWVKINISKNCGSSSRFIWCLFASGFATFLCLWLFVARLFLFVAVCG